MSDKAQTLSFRSPLPLVLWCIHRTATARGNSAPDCRARAPTGVFSGAGARPMYVQFAAFALSNDERIAGFTARSGRWS